MKTLKHPQFIIPIIIIIIMLGWIGYQKINKIKIKQEEKQAAEQEIDVEKVDIEEIDVVDENADETLSGDSDQTQKAEPDDKSVIANHAKDANTQEPKDGNQIDTADWNSFTHKTYGYTVKFPKTWHWDGTDINILIISSQLIKSKSENLTVNNLKIIKANQEIIEEILEENANAEIVSLNDNFKAVYLKNHQFKNIIEQIIKSFEI